LAIQFLQVGVNAWIQNETAAVRAVRQFRVLSNIPDGVEPEPVNSLVQPETDHFIDFLPELRVGPIEVWLERGETAEIPLVVLLVISPGTSLKNGIPVVGRHTRAFSFPPVVIVVVFAVWVLNSLLEPFTLVTGVVHDEVHDQFHSSAMHFLKKTVKVFHGTVVRLYGVVVTDVVTVVPVRTPVDRGEPENIHSQVFQVVQLGLNARKVSNAISVAVTETLWPDLINNRAFPPLIKHFSTSFLLEKLTITLIITWSHREKKTKNGAPNYGCSKGVNMYF